MASLLIFGDPEQFRSRRLLQEWQAQGHDGIIINPLTTIIETGENGLQFDFSSYGLSTINAIVVFESLAHFDLYGLVELLAQQYGARVFFNGEKDRVLSIHSALFRYNKLLRAGILMPHTKIVAAGAFDLIMADVKYPVVLKRIRSSAKKAIGLAYNESELRELIQKLHRTGAFYQLREYIEHDKEWRVMMVGGEPVSVLERAGRSEAFLASFADDAIRIGRTIEEVPDVIDVARQVNKGMGDDLQGIDIIRGRKNGELYVIDVNPAPSYAVSEEITGINIAGKIVEYMLREISSK